MRVLLGLSQVLAVFGSLGPIFQLSDVDQFKNSSLAEK